MLREISAMDYLTIPLGQNRKQRPPICVGLLLRLGLIVLCLPLSIFALWVLFAEDRLGGEPITVSQIKLGTETVATTSQTPVPETIPSSSPAVAQEPMASAGGKTVVDARTWWCRIPASQPRHGPPVAN